MFSFQCVSGLYNHGRQQGLQYGRCRWEEDTRMRYKGEGKRQGTDEAKGETERKREEDEEGEEEEAQRGEEVWR